MTISVFLVDDHDVVRRGLAGLVAVEDDMAVIGEAATAAQALARVPALRPDVAVLDVRLPDGDGVSVCRQLRALITSPPACLLLTSHADDEALFGALMAGAAGYVLKQINGLDLVGAIRTAAEGGSVLPPTAAAVIRERMHGAGVPDDPRFAILGFQERRMLALIADGLTNRQIGEQMHLAERTVQNTISALLHKLGVTRRTEAAVFAS